MTREHIILRSENVHAVKGPEVKVKGPKYMDPFTMRLAAVGLIVYDCFRYPLKKGFIVMDFAKRTATLAWGEGGNNG